MRPEDKLEAQLTKTLDETVEMHMTRSEKVVSQRTPLDVEFERACKAFVAANRTFEIWNAKPDKYDSRVVRLRWWEALGDVCQKERVVKDLFIGGQPDPLSNRQYAQFRETLLNGEKTKANA